MLNADWLLFNASIFLTMTRRIAVVPGDGIGKEVIPNALEVVRATGASVEFTTFDWGADRYLIDGTTIPAGEQGNDRPIETTDEYWTTRDSTMMMLHIFDDPRAGHTVTEVTELIRGEPDPSLFAPPPGYKLVEQVRTTKPVAPAQ